MREKNFKKYFSFFVLGLFLFFYGAGPALSYVMSSNDFRVQFDSVNFGGGYGNSSDYNLQDTLGEIGTGFSSGTDFGLGAGYQQMSLNYLALGVNADTVNLANISGLTGGTSSGSVTWTVTTDNTAGYTLSVKAVSTPALVCVSGGCAAGSDHLGDYAPVTPGTPDYNWAILSTTSSFGYTSEGSDIVSKFKNEDDDDYACGVPSEDAVDRCWYGFSTVNEAVAQSVASNHPVGATTTLKFQAEAGSSRLQSLGNYQAQIIVTAVPN